MGHGQGKRLLGVARARLPNVLALLLCASAVWPPSSPALVSADVLCRSGSACAVGFAGNGSGEERIVAESGLSLAAAGGGLTTPVCRQPEAPPLAAAFASDCGDALPDFPPSADGDTEER
jgi:hypothetical protein